MGGGGGPAVWECVRERGGGKCGGSGWEVRQTFGSLTR